MKSKRKSLTLGSFEDLVSIGALLRPSIEQATSKLSKSDLASIKAIVINAEKILANSKESLSVRFKKVVETLKSSYQYGPIWRLVASKIEELGQSYSSKTNGLKELNSVSLILGIAFETLEAKEKKNSKKNDRAA